MTTKIEPLAVPLQNEAEVAQYLGISVRTLQGLRSRDKGLPIQAMKGPPWIAIGGAIRYRVSDILAYEIRCQNSAGRSK